MKIAIDQIRDVSREFHFLQAADLFPVLADMAAAGECRFLGPVEVHLTAAREMEHYRVEGTVTVPVQMACSRCLASFERTLSSRFTIFFRQGSSVVADEDEVELEERDLISVPFSGDELDLSPEIGEQVALAVPFKPLCSDDCKGLCPHCGTDLNVSYCDCGHELVNLKFAALKDFKIHR